LYADLGYPFEKALDIPLTQLPLFKETRFAEENIYRYNYLLSEREGKTSSPG